MNIDSLILQCPGCKKHVVTSNFAILVTLEDRDGLSVPRILLNIHCNFCSQKYQSKLDSEDFIVLG